MEENKKMSNTEYVRNAANKYGWKKYYSIMRPVGIRMAPKFGMMDFINYDDRKEIRTNNGIIKAWAEIYYNRELTEQELWDYEIVRG